MHPDRFAALSRSLGDSTSRRGLLRLLGVGVAGTAITAVGLTEAQAERKRGRNVRAQKKKAPLEPNPFGDSFTSADGLVVYEVTNFVINDAGQLAAVGNVTVGGVADTFTALVTPTQASCRILHLELGPLELDILGLVITIPDPIIIDITAYPGAGNLLGNLLCAIAGLLDPGGPLEDILEELVGLLRRLLNLFG
jgi:hypothetical protein